MKHLMLTLTIVILNTGFIHAQTTPQVWYQYQHPSMQNMNDIYSNIVVGNSGVILKRISNLQYDQVTSGTNVNLYSIARILNPLIITGANGVILKGDASATSFQLINTGVTEDLYSADRMLISANPFPIRYFAVGRNGTIIRSNDNGDTWMQVSSPVTTDLNHIFVPSGFWTNGWIAGNGGVMLRTTDAGDTWSVINTPVTTDLTSVVFTSQNTGYITGNNGVILKTTNSGTSWTILNTGTTENLKSIFFNAETNAYAVGESSTIIRTTNAGNTWIKDDVILPGINFNSVLITGIPLAAGDGGNIFYRTSDTLRFPYKFFNPNRISTWFSAYGVFNQNFQFINTPGFQWPAGSGKFASFTSGLSIFGKINGQLRMAAASYTGEFYLGRTVNGLFQTNPDFRMYRVDKGVPSYDRDNWNKAVAQGAPYVDVNNNGIYDPGIDIPGVKDAQQTFFACYSDADTSSHNLGEGFGGGTLPLGAEVRIIAWAYNTGGNTFLDNTIFMRFEILNRSLNNWEQVHFSLFNDFDLGNAVDDYVGCDTIRNMGYVYNAIPSDGTGAGNSYGTPPPACGNIFLRGAIINGVDLGLSSFMNLFGSASAPPPCESTPTGDPLGAFNFAQGVKKDLTPYVIPNTSPPQITKFNYSGDPETRIGWTEFDGYIANCGGSLTGNHYIITGGGDRRPLMNSGSDLLTMMPGDTQRIYTAQVMALGSSNVNSVTVLKSVADSVINYFNTNVSIHTGEVEILPEAFRLYQNYPNPFNPETTIKFDVPVSSNNTNVSIRIYDMTGRFVHQLTNQNFIPGSYEMKWNASGFASGVYFYTLVAGSYIETKKALLLK